MLLLTQAHSRRIPAKHTTHPIISLHKYEKEEISASDDSERLSEARHHAAQGKAFALFIVPSNKYLDHREHPDQQITSILCSWIHMESLLTDQVLNHLTDQEQS